METTGYVVEEIFDLWGRTSSCQQISLLLSPYEVEPDAKISILREVFWNAVGTHNWSLAECSMELGFDITSSDLLMKYEVFGPVCSAMERFGDCPDTIRWLAAKGADLMWRGRNNYTPLHLAASINSTEIAKILLESGVDINCRTLIDDNDTPLHVAARQGNRRVYEFLTACGADSQIRNAYGERAPELIASAR